MKVEYFGDSLELSWRHSSPKTPRSAPVSNAGASESVRSSDSMNFQYDTPDVDKTAGKKKRGSKYTSGGLRQFSSMVCNKLKSKGKATYNEYDDKNVRRRVYDAVNVLLAMDIIIKEKKQMWWKGLRDPNTIDLEGIKAQRIKLMGRIGEKEACLKDLEEQMADLQNLMLRNKQLLKSGNSHHKGFSFPFIHYKRKPF